MKVKRQKISQKRLNFYKVNFGIAPPYRVLIDGTFCNAALQNKVNLAEQVPKYFREETKLCTTTCAIAELASLGAAMTGPMKILQQFTVVNCDHADKAIPVFHCFKSKYKNNKLPGPRAKYCVGTQDQQIREKARKFGAVPLVYLHSRTLTLEKPSDITKVMAQEHEEKQRAPSELQKQTLESMKHSLGVEDQQPTIKKKRKTPKGPNPLSCKKKKKKPQQQPADKKRARKRKKTKHPEDNT